MSVPMLPDLSRLDREALQALLLAEHEERIATHQQSLQRESEIETLKLLLSQLRRMMQFGRKSEKLQQLIEELEPGSSVRVTPRIRNNRRRRA